MPYSVSLSKDRFKFSATHFTIFSETEAEGLHGHNYQVSAHITFKDLEPDTGLTSEFSKLKQALTNVCERLDEKVLLPQNSPYLQIGETQTNIEVKYAERFYSFPKQDCQVLEIVNTSSECLAQWFHEQLSEAFLKLGAKSFTLSLQETLGQSVTYEKPSGILG